MPRYNLAEYETVDSRITKFYDDHPEGAILTSLVSDPNNLEKVVIKCAVYFKAGAEVRATGYAFEYEGKSTADGANFGSHLENCETSSIGRALANAGYKVKKDAPRPSQSEMEKAERFTTGEIPAKFDKSDKPAERKSTATRAQEELDKTGEKYPMQGNQWDGPEGTRCPSCNAPTGKRHGSKCTLKEN